MYPRISQVAFFVTLELVNLNIGNKMPYESSSSYIDNLQVVEMQMMEGATKATLEDSADLLMMDMRDLYSSIETVTMSQIGCDPGTLSDHQH